MTNVISYQYRYPFDGACLTNNLVYKAVVTEAGHGNKEYVGMTEHEF